MNAPQEPTPEPILRFESPDEIDDAVESMLHPTLDECDDEALLELDDEYWEALLLDDDYEVLPEEGDFWTDQEAA